MGQAEPEPEEVEGPGLKTCHGTMRARHGFAAKSQGLSGSHGPKCL